MPDLFWHEVRSVLLIGERKGRIEVGATNDHMKDIRTLSIETDADQDDAAVSTLSRQHGLSGYDAAYLETAIRRKARLSTLDKGWLSQPTVSDPAVAPGDPATLAQRPLPAQDGGGLPARQSPRLGPLAASRRPHPFTHSTARS